MHAILPRRLGLLCLLLLGCLAPDGSAPRPARQDAGTRELAVAPAIGLTPTGLTGLVATLERSGAEVLLRVVVADASGRPVAGTPVEVAWSGGLETGSTDETGELRVRLAPERCADLSVSVPSRVELVVDVPALGVSSTAPLREGETFSLRLDPSAGPIRPLDLDALPSLRSGALTVHHDPGCEDAAAVALAALGRMRGFAAGLVGFDVLDSPFGTVVTDLRSYVIAGPQTFVTHPESWRGSAPSSTSGGTGEGTLLHEWLEHQLPLETTYHSDPRLRVAGDGLAELLAVAYCRRFDPAGALERLERYERMCDTLLEQGSASYDLRVFVAITEGAKQAGLTAALFDPDTGAPNLVQAAGYAAALWFWTRVADEHGTAAVGDVLHWLVEEDAGPRTLDGLLDRLEASGDRPATTIDLARARAGLRAMASEVRGGG